MNENNVSIFALKIRSHNLFLGWGLFTLFVLLPIFLVAGLYFSIIFLSFIIIALIVFMVTWILLMISIDKLRDKFWIHIEALDYFWDTMFPAISGFLIMGFLFWWFFKLLGEDTSEFLYFHSFLWLTSLLFYYFLMRYFNSRNKGERFKCFRGKIEDIDEIVRKALDSLNFKYSRVVEGSKWIKLTPSYLIEGSDISVKVWKVSKRKVRISTNTQSDSDVPKAREIEKSIDSLIDVTKR
jgi:hypothetical protein